MRLKLEDDILDEFAREEEEQKSDYANDEFEVDKSNIDRESIE